MYVISQGYTKHDDLICGPELHRCPERGGVSITDPLFDETEVKMSHVPLASCVNNQIVLAGIHLADGTCTSLRSILIGEADEAGRCSLPIPSDYRYNHSVGSLHLQWHEVSLSFIHTRVCAQTQAHPYTCIFVSTFKDNVFPNHLTFKPQTVL